MYRMSVRDILCVNTLNMTRSLLLTAFEESESKFLIYRVWKESLSQVDQWMVVA